MPSPKASRRNLWNYWQRVGRPCSGDESALRWRLTLQWWMQDDDQRNPKTQREWAEKIGVSQPYVAKMMRRFNCEWLDLAMKWTDWQEVTLTDLAEAREVRIRARARLAEEREWEQYEAAQRDSRDDENNESEDGHIEPDSDEEESTPDDEEE